MEVLSFANEQRRYKRTGMSTMGKISVVMATADRPQMVLDCVKSFSAQVPQDVELIVADAGLGSPVDEDALKKLWPLSKVVRVSQKNAAVQRNKGVCQAMGDIVIFLDDDCYVQPGWWPAIVQTFSDEKVGAVAGAVWCNPSPRFTDERGGYVNLLGLPVQVTHRGKGAPREVDWALTTNMAVRKSVFEAVGGFAPVYGIYDEDVDLGLKIREAGWRIVFEPDAAVYHYFLKRPRIETKKTAFRDGRNRSILLVRNYGVSIRLIFFFLTAPLIQLFQALRHIGQSVITGFGHAVAFIAGMIVGVVEGGRNSIKNDRQKYDKKPQE